jgi:hypothetical protein
MEKNNIMKITRRHLRQIIKEELSLIKESSRAGESNAAGYEDGSSGREPKYLDNMDYMAGWETGNEDHEFDKERLSHDADRDGIADFADTDKNNDGQVDVQQDQHDDVHTRIGETYSKEQQMPDSWAQILGNCLGDKN